MVRKGQILLRKGVLFTFVRMSCVLLCIDLEWKIIYVGSAEDEQYDQTLDCIMVGPVPAGINKFVYQVRDFVFPFKFNTDYKHSLIISYIG